MFLGYITILLIMSILGQIETQNLNEEIKDFFEGDILGIPPKVNQLNGLIDPYYRWDEATIPFEFETGYSLELRARFHQAAQHISSRTCLKFIPRTSQKNFIKVINGLGCYSYIGRLGTGEQQISLATGCVFGTFVHELIHSIGFYHEQSRTDRDDFVAIKWENIQNGFEHNFGKYDASIITSFGIPYDHTSVMHYSSHAFSKNGQPTIVTKPKGIPIGQRRGMSKKDVLKINKMYNCNKSKGRN